MGGAFQNQFSSTSGNPADWNFILFGTVDNAEPWNFNPPSDVVNGWTRTINPSGFIRTGVSQEAVDSWGTYIRS